MVKATKAKSGNTDLQDHDPEHVVYEYLQRQNRPFSANDIFQNLHGTLGKTAITKLLGSMADKGKITAKTFGKSVIYFPNQNESEALSEEEEKQLDQEIEHAKTDLESIKAKVQAQQKVLQTLKSSLPTAALRDRIRVLEEETQRDRERLERLLQGGGPTIDPADRKRLEHSLKSYKAMWVLKRRLVKDAVNMITEQLDRQPKSFMDDLGIDTDESVGCDLQVVFNTQMPTRP